MSEKLSQNPLVYVACGVAGGLLLAQLFSGKKEQAITGPDKEVDKEAKPAVGTDPLELVRKNIMELQPYRCARDDYSSGILLDANENTHGPPLTAEENTLTLERYPSPYLPELKDQIAKFRGVRRNQIFLGVGSDEVIDMLIRIFCRPQTDTIMITPPTYGMYKVSANVNDVGVQKVPLTPDFALDIDSMVKAVTAATKLIFVCSPGNPTARSIPHADIVRLCNSVGCMVVVDEAYVDFSDEGSACKLLDQHSNLIVSQTMSKSFGLAGIRLGMAYAAEDLIQVLNNVKAPYSVNKLTESVARKAFDNLDLVFENIEKIKSQKKIVIEGLKKMPFIKKIHRTDANFVLFSVPDHAHAVYKRIANEGIVIRYRGDCLHCTDCLRMTVGTPDENVAFLKKLPEVYEAVVAGNN